MPGLVQAHSHRSTTKTTHKPFKSRFTSKNALKDKAKGKLGSANGPRKTRFQEVMSKFDRKNQAKQIRQNKQKDHARVLDIFKGKDGAPRNIAVVPLCEDVSGSFAVEQLNKCLDIQAQVPAQGSTHVSVDRFKQKLLYSTVCRSLFDALDACKASDYVLLVLSAQQEVDDLGDLLLRSIEAQGISTVYTAVQGLDKIEPPKRRPQVLASLKSYISHFFPDQEKVFCLDSAQECQNVVRSLCTTTPRGIRWREDRAWMAVEQVQWPSDESADEGQTGEVVLTGVVRGQNLQPDRLLQVGDWGTFQISAIAQAAAEQSRKGKDHQMAFDAEPGNILSAPTEDQDLLETLAPEDAVMEELETIGAPSTMATERRGVLLDDQHHFEEVENSEENHQPKRLPRGTSKYQSAWYLGDASDSGSDLESVDEDMEGIPQLTEAGPADGIDALATDREMTEAAPSEYPQSEAPFNDADDDQEAADLEAFRARRSKDAAEDLRFPDEIELHPNVSARERLARYRGLKSLRSSPWDTEEDRPYMPAEWPRLLDIADYRGAKSRVMRDSLVGGVKPGTRCSIHLRQVPLHLQKTHDPSKSLAAYSLLRHEFKHTSLNFSFTLSSDAAEPLKSKEELIMQVGPRRMVIHPLFSQGGNTSNDVHKFERYVHPGRTVVASFTGPLTWGSVPAIFYRKKQNTGSTSMDTDQGDAGLELVGHGTSMPPSTSRIIAKRVVLTGEPFKINRRVVTVRYMFFNADDVQWFKALPLWTNRGRQGTIKESLGTHGYFKAMFDAKTGLQDAVGVSLYKRVWSRPAKMLGAGSTLS